MLMIKTKLNEMHENKIAIIIIIIHNEQEPTQKCA
jgi:hypothetical protein